MNGRHVVLALLLLLLLLLGPTGPGAQDDRPNFLIVMADDLDFSLMEYMPRTRALIADQGMAFARFFVSVSLCCPSRATLLTGRYAHNHGVTDNVPPEGGYIQFRPHENQTLATELQRRGYRTGLIGKYFNGYGEVIGEPPWPVPPGWSVWRARVGVGRGYYYGFTINSQGQKVAYTREHYHTDVTALQAEAFIRGAAATPWFLLVTPIAPHEPAAPARRHQDAPVTLARRPASFNERDVTDKPEWVRLRERLGRNVIADLDARQTQRARATMAIDEMVERLVHVLDETGQIGRTHIVFTSDNGYHMGEHRVRQGKRTAYEESIRVPLLWRGPSVRRGVTSVLALNVDLAPTIMRYAGGPRPTWMDGRIMQGVLHGDAPNDPRIVALIEHPVAGSDVPAYYGARTADYTYVEYETGERELYDHRTDPAQLVNIVGTAPACLVERLRSRARALAVCITDACRELEALPVACVD
jgi:arylsulfatase A-like enzyme